jgi:glucosylceramidase
MRPRRPLLLLAAFIASFLTASAASFSALPKSNEAQLRLTNHDKSALFAPQSPIVLTKPSSSANSATISIDTKKSFQPIDGFGFALTGGSAQQLHHMDASKRAALLRELFATDANNIGISYLRFSIGASDFNDHVYSYDDVLAGEIDPQLNYFTLKDDRIDLLPVLKEVLAINPRIQIFCSPWSAPAWMKTNVNIKGGELEHEYNGAYAIIS